MYTLPQTTNPTGEGMTAPADGKTDEVETTEGVGIVRAREILGELVNRAGYGNERIVIMRNDKQSAAIVGMRDLERLRKLDGADA